MIVKMLKRGLLLCVRWRDDREDAEADRDDGGE